MTRRGRAAAASTATSTSGKGCLGTATFARLLNDPRFANLPMVIETPKQKMRPAGGRSIRSTR